VPLTPLTPLDLKEEGTAISATVKVYHLYTTYDGRVSNKTTDYHGELIQVAAVSIRQAYYLAGHNEWADQPGDTGIVSYYWRSGPKGDGGPDHLLWCGCYIYGGLNIEHMSSKTRMVKAMIEHMDEDHRSAEPGAPAKE
jgi:hypothetical protein